jgi:predicted CoA-binding protein
MASDYERFWEHESYAVVGHSAKKSFPKLTYRGLKKLGKKVFPVDPSVPEIDGDKTSPDLSSLPDPVDAVVLELPKGETKDWVAKVAEAGIKHLWMHMQSDTPEAIALAAEKGIQFRTGTCAVMYVTPGLSFHSIHRWIDKARGKY